MKNNLEQIPTFSSMVWLVNCIQDSLSSSSHIYSFFAAFL